jgi:hypothetical protein
MNQRVRAQPRVLRDPLPVILQASLVMHEHLTLDSAR